MGQEWGGMGGGREGRAGHPRAGRQLVWSCAPPSVASSAPTVITPGHGTQSLHSPPPMTGAAPHSPLHSGWGKERRREGKDPIPWLKPHPPHQFITHRGPSPPSHQLGHRMPHAKAGVPGGGHGCHPRVPCLPYPMPPSSPCPILTPLTLGPKYGSPNPANAGASLYS